MTELNDQVLLSRYLRGTEDAFRQLLDRHSGLVYGTALRVTGDPGAAEEVSQDVFVLLARKARSLLTHPSVAGWLHRTSQNVARHEQRRRLRQKRKVARISEDAEAESDVAVSPAAPTALSGVDEAVARLPKLDREAILLRFFEDLEYEEIARRLEISEPAARKRVSRAVKRLQERLGPEHSSAAVSGALVIAAPAYLVGEIAPALPAAGSAAASLTFTNILTTMTTNTALKVTGIAVVGGALIIGNVMQAGKNRSLATELESVQEQLRTLRGGTAGTSSVAGDDGEKSGASGDANGNRAHTTSGKIAALSNDLERERARRAAVEEELAEFRERYGDIEGEVVVAFGKVSEIGRDFGSLFSEARFLSEMEKEGRLEEEDVKRRLAKFYQSAAAMGGLSRQIVEMEGDPEEGSELFSATYAELFDLDDATRRTLHGIFEKHITAANEKNISLKQITALIDQDLPGGFEEEMERLMKQRQAYFRDVRAELRAAIPEEHHADFDQWVEKDGIGFNNLKLRDTPLQFSLGGDQKAPKTPDPDLPPQPRKDSDAAGEDAAPPE